jgi:hypothetical protein
VRYRVHEHPTPRGYASEPQTVDGLGLAGVFGVRLLVF